MFTLPVVDSGATQIKVDLTYEFLVQVTPSAKDFAQLTATDSFTVTVR